MANAAARRLLGDDVASAIEGILAPEGEFVDEARAEVVRSDGRHVVLQVGVAPISDADGRPAEPSTCFTMSRSVNSRSGPSASS